MIKPEQNKTIWTIGHSTHTLDEFIAMLKSLQIKLVANIRSFPGSRRYPHLIKKHLKFHYLKIKYTHLKELGERRKVQPDSINTGWRVAAFRGYADYMETNSFKIAITELEAIASNERTAYMCSEGVWWRCHRSLVSDYLKFNGWTVLHIMVGKVEGHPYTSPARLVGNHLIYSK